MELRFFGKKFIRKRTKNFVVFECESKVKIESLSFKGRLINFVN